MGLLFIEDLGQSADIECAQTSDMEDTELTPQTVHFLLGSAKLIN